MANPVRTWGDLADPDIDPFGFPRELPQHFAEVAALLSREAEDIESAADSGAKGAELFAGYVEYLNSAEVQPSIVADISAASEEIQCAVRMIQNAAEAMSRAATLAEQARREAESSYGDMEMPRFDKANAG